MTVETPARRSRWRRLVFKMGKRPDLQGMRAVAVLAVFADHLFGWPSGGFVGVDVFFVLSGFFITGLLLRERSQTGAVSFQNFYVRRVKRIIPAALLVLVTTVVAAQFLFPAARAKETLLDALWAAVFGANIRFEAVGADYFQQGLPPSPIQHYWSLSIEEQFYFVWPWVLAGIFLLTRKPYRRGHVWVRHWGLFASMGVIVAASFGWAMYLSASDPNAAYFSTFTRVWELGIGALLAIASPWLGRIPAAIRPGLNYLGLAGVGASLFLISSTVQFPAPWAALPVLSTALVISSFHGAEVRAVPVLTNPVARWFGDTSYTLYLWHWPVIIMLQSVMPKHDALFYVLAAGLALGLTASTYYFYEDPIRKSGWLLDNASTTCKRNKRRPLAPHAWGLIGFVSAATVVVTILGFGYVDKVDAVQEEIAYGDNSQIDLSPEEKADPCFGAPAMVTPGCLLSTPGVSPRPGIDRFSKDNRGQRECFRSSTEDETLKVCQFGYDGPDAVRIAIVGDSHAAALLPALWPILLDNRWHLTTYLGAACIMKEPPAGECRGLMSQITAELAANPYALVITTSHDRGSPPENLRKAWEPVLAAGSRMAVVANNPGASEESLACLTRVGGGDKIGECGTPRAEAVPHSSGIVAAAEADSAVTLIDFTDLYCNADRCPSVIGDVIVYRDASDETKNSHITATFARTLSPSFQEGLLRAFG